MHMNSAPHLLNEDRKDYERILDEALRTAPHRPELAAVGERLNPEQLRTMALNATALITAAAATEYQHYVKVREELRDPTRSTASAREPNTSEPTGGSVGLATTMGEVTETAGAGLVAVLAVLAPVLAGTAAAIFLLVGYILKMISPEPALADTLLTAGWIFGALTAAGILVAAGGLLLTALRNGSTAQAAGPPEEFNEEVSHAREVWRDALLERGLVPFLREALAQPRGTPDPGPAPSGTRMPSLGYNRPGFSSPEGDTDTGPSSPSDTSSSRPRYSSPDFSSPDFGGPEHRPD
ncbi:hypothetical protein RCO28_25615 [Streptomyces sp. LHD-70]|uniref:hypothetical protein n=1 Tax=Streptomyces sp. LHD-70 TaxID=3072140 RepID=UPI0028107329|nr:hypothetical protein [Streptomyces sp. LHD-70]MDQ8705848.1 hypothetical protein [Streptomyces sp. LHD-70]